MDDAPFAALGPIHDDYGRVLTGSTDLNTDACTTAEALEQAPAPALHIRR